MLTRRRLLTLLAALPVQAKLSAAQVFPRRRKTPLPQPLVFFGTDTTRPAAKGIYRARFDANAGRFSQPELAAACVRPSFLAVNELTGGKARGRVQPLRHMLYAVNAGDVKTSGVTTFALDPATGTLQKMGEVSSGGEGPCYVSVDASGDSVYVANYNGGTVASYKVQTDGQLSGPVQVVDLHNAAVFGHHGPNKARQDGPHPHSTNVTPDNRFIIVNDLGDDSIAIFPIDTTTAHLGVPHLFQTMTPGTGPRHVAFHPNNRWVYGIDELASRLDHYLYTATHAAPGIEAQAELTSTGHSVSTLDPGYHGVNTAAEVFVAPTGDYLYASNRGEDSLVVFAIEATTGALTLRQRIGCGGKTPRHFTFDHSGDWLICTNQDSASVTVFARDPGTGRLSGPVQTLALESPMFTLFL